MLFSMCLFLGINTGAMQGFEFVRFKTEWDAIRAIKRINGRCIGGRNILVQMAKYDSRNKNTGSYYQINKLEWRRGAILGDVLRHKTATINVAASKSQDERQDVWVEKEGFLNVVTMKREAVDTFVAVEARLNVDEKETGEWLVGKAGVAVEVKELNCSFFLDKTHFSYGFPGDIAAYQAIGRISYTTY